MKPAPLTDEQIETLRIEKEFDEWGITEGAFRYAAKDIEAAVNAKWQEMLAKQEPVAWEWRWFDKSPYTVTSGQWSEWKRVEPRSALQSVEDAVNEYKAYIAQGYRYELRALYTTPPDHTAVMRQALTALERLDLYEHDVGLEVAALKQALEDA